MEEEMRKIEEEFAFQEKWIKIFKRGKFFFQNIPEHLILKIITKMEVKVFFNLLRTGKWIYLLCRENRDSLLIFLKISDYYYDYMGKNPAERKNKKKKDIPQLRKTIRSKFYFFLWHRLDCYKNLEPFLEDLYSKEVYHFRRGCWNIRTLEINELPSNSSIINHLQPIIIEISMKQNGPLPENFNIPARTKDFFVYYASISDSDFYKEIKRFGSLPLKAKFKRIGHLDLDKLFSTLKRITQEKHLHHPLQFLTYQRESRSNYAIFNSWPMDSSFPSSKSNLFYFIIVAKSDVGVSVIHLYRIGQSYTLQIMGIKSFDEWEQFTKRGYFNLEDEALEVFSAQIASKFFEGGKLVYSPPEPAPEFVEFLKEFEDFDIQPEKLAPHKPKWKKTEKLPDLPQKLPEIHLNNWLIEAKEVIKLRKIWLDFLQKKKFIMELLPEKNVLDVARRGNRFKEVLQWIRERKICVRRISLGKACPMIQELFESFTRGPELLCISQNVTLPAPVQFSPQLVESILFSTKCRIQKEIVVNVGSFIGDQTKRFIEGFTGIEQAVIWYCDDDKDTNATITYQLETLKSKKCRSNILISSRTARYPYIVNYDLQFYLSRISKTVFIFRSMARGRGGVWNYFIRLEKAGSGAVGIVLFADSLHIIEGSETNYFDIRCGYFPTMDSFLDYFEREVGSKRRARDWMQLREKDVTIEPREKDFKKFKKLTPFIHFNEQKEVNDLNEVWRRFFL